MPRKTVDRDLDGKLFIINYIGVISVTQTFVLCSGCQK